MTEECAANKIASVRPSTAPRHRCRMQAEPTTLWCRGHHRRAARPMKRLEPTLRPGVPTIRGGP